VTAQSAARANAWQLRAFVLELGRALSLAGTAVNETQQRLLRVTAANGAPDSRVVVLPTVLMVSFGRTRRTVIESIPQRTGALRLDQISALYELIKQAEGGNIPPADGLDKMAAIAAMQPRYGRLITVLGYTLMTIGLCLILQPTPLDVAIAAGFGAFVGALILTTRGHETLTVLVPIISAMIVSALTFEAVKLGIADPGLRTLIAPLVTFLPGGVLTTATVELAFGEMVAGASRLVFGALQLLLLAFGIVAGAEIAGRPKDLSSGSHMDLLGWWAPWLGVLLFGIATALYFSAPRGALRWLLLVVFVAWVGQLAGDALVGANVSGFFGAVAMTPVALAVARLPSGPPSQVTFLPAFWLLVPGAIGLIGVTDIVGNPATAGLQDLVQPVTSIVAIALGVLCGASIYRALAAGPGHLRRARHTSGSDPSSDKRPSRSTPPPLRTSNALPDE
jgi:uncharacterized membrane protein YjjP (DUF1212 family)